MPFYKYTEEIPQQINPMELGAEDVVWKGTGAVGNAGRMKKKSACGNLSLGFTPQNRTYLGSVEARLGMQIA